ncbi:hypothetical protein OF83DRAFT_1174014 [Amylostereum chailletii]|nr:hypothetical protein OF83DRAFT_1174014 [Amylostereum chailletii]
MQTPLYTAASQLSLTRRDPSSSPEPEPETLPPKQRVSASRKRGAPSRDVSLTLQLPPFHRPPPSLQRSESRADSSTSGSDIEIVETVPKFSEPPVWVRVTTSGYLAPKEGDGGSAEDCVWWPAGVVSGSITKGPLHVFLLAPISPRTSRRIRISTPNPFLVLPMRKPGRPALYFTAATFRCPTGDSSMDPPSKRPRRSLDTAFQEAVRLMHEADTEQNEGMPSKLSSYVRPDDPGDESSELTEEEPSSVEEERWSPPPCDPNLEIPGEPVLAIEKRIKTHYWPARIEEYVAPKNPRDKPKYRVTFLDETTFNIERNMFYTSSEEEFYTCKMGTFESNEDSAENYVDTDEFDDRLDLGFVPPIPPPEPIAFCNMPLPHQFAYTIPVLQAILMNVYEPVKRRHEQFMAGGRSRDLLRKEATGIGELLTSTATRFWHIAHRWALHGDTHSEGLSDEQASRTSGGIDQSVPIEYSRATSVLTDLADLEHPSMSCGVTSASFLSGSSQSGDVRDAPRVPGGCPEFEALSFNDRRQYCFLVLDHEATLQLLLWRAGERKSLELLSQEEEERLHDVALRLAAAVDIADQVVQIRNLRASKAAARAAASPQVEGTSRLRRSKSNKGGTKLRSRRTSSVRYS